MASILVVEDERVLERVFTLNLSRRGHTVAEADSVESARQMIMAGDFPFDLILLDINLPDGTGWELLRSLPHLLQFKAVRPRVIIVTAIRPSAERLRAFMPDAVLLKPFPISTMLRLIERVIDGEDVESVAFGEP